MICDQCNEHPNRCDRCSAAPARRKPRWAFTLWSVAGGVLVLALSPLVIGASAAWGLWAK